jgi:hypothetical protein
MSSMEWTPEALKAEVEYRQCALRADARRARLVEHDRSRSWWYRLTHR